MKELLNTFLCGTKIYHHCFKYISSEDILDYVTVQMPPLHPSLPRPRFSLYLSSQLQYGVVIVYHRQCAFLLGERGEGERDEGEGERDEGKERGMKGEGERNKGLSF